MSASDISKLRLLASLLELDSSAFTLLVSSSMFSCASLSSLYQNTEHKMNSHSLSNTLSHIATMDGMGFNHYKYLQVHYGGNILAYLEAFTMKGKKGTEIDYNLETNSAAKTAE